MHLCGLIKKKKIKKANVGAEEFVHNIKKTSDVRKMFYIINVICIKALSF